MKVLIFSLFLVFSFTSITNAKTGFVLEKGKNISTLSKNIVNSSLYSGGYQSCIDDCDAEYDYYCSGANAQSWECEYLIDELYACYDYCDSSYP